MCIATITFGHPAYAAIIASNRDEWFDRPAQPLAWWHDDNILGGRDCSAGGTWLAINRNGRFGLITNVRGQAAINTDSNRSRGELIPQWLNFEGNYARFSDQLKCNAQQYAGFNLIFGEFQNAANASLNVHYFTNAGDSEVQKLWPINFRNESEERASLVTYGLSNAQLDTPWPKLEKLKKINERVYDLHAMHIDARICDALLMNLLDSESFDGSPLSAINVSASDFLNTGRDYGRRASSVILVPNQGDIAFTESGSDGTIRSIRFGRQISELIR